MINNMSYLPHYLWDYIFRLAHEELMKPTFERIHLMNDVEYICSVFWCSTYCLYHLVYEERLRRHNMVSEYQRDYQSWLDEFTECMDTIGELSHTVKSMVVERLKTSERYSEMLKEARDMELDRFMKRRNISIWRKFKKVWNFIF